MPMEAAIFSNEMEQINKNNKTIFKYKYKYKHKNHTKSSFTDIP